MLVNYNYFGTTLTHQICIHKKNQDKIKLMEFLLFFGPESFVFSFINQKYID